MLLSGRSHDVLTDVIEVLRNAGYPVVPVLVGDARDTHGVNDRLQLARAEAELRRRINERWTTASAP